MAVAWSAHKLQILQIWMVQIERGGARQEGRGRRGCGGRRAGRWWCCRWSRGRRGRCTGRCTTGCGRRAWRARLPWPRPRAAELGGACNTVALAYEQVRPEGHVGGARGGGTRGREALPDALLQVRSGGGGAGRPAARNGGGGQGAEV